MEKMVGVSDPSIEEFIEKYRDVKYTSLFDRVIVDVHDVRIGEYLDRKSELYGGVEIRLPIMVLPSVEGVSAEVFDVSDSLEMTVIFVFPTGDGYQMVYFYNGSDGSFYSAMLGSAVTTLVKEKVGTLRDLFGKLLELSKVDSYVFEEFNFYNHSILSYVKDRVGDGGDTVKFTGDSFDVYKVYTDKDGRVTTMSTIGMSRLDTGYESGDREVGFELIAGYLNEIGGSSDWFKELVYDLYMSDVSMSPGFCVTGLTELEKLNKGFVAVVMIPPSLWDSFELLKVENRAVLWLWAVPITSREFKLLQSGGLDELLEYWNKNRTQLLDISRRDKRFKFF